MAGLIKGIITAAGGDLVRDVVRTAASGLGLSTKRQRPSNLAESSLSDSTRVQRGPIVGQSDDLRVEPRVAIGERADTSGTIVPGISLRRMRVDTRVHVPPSGSVSNVGASDPPEDFDVSGESKSSTSEYIDVSLTYARFAQRGQIAPYLAGSASGQVKLTDLLLPNSSVTTYPNSECFWLYEYMYTHQGFPAVWFTNESLAAPVYDAENLVDGQSSSLIFSSAGTLVLGMCCATSDLSVQRPIILARLKREAPKFIMRQTPRALGPGGRIYTGVNPAGYGAVDLADCMSSLDVKYIKFDAQIVPPFVHDNEPRTSYLMWAIVRENEAPPRPRMTLVSLLAAERRAFEFDYTNKFSLPYRTWEHYFESSDTFNNVGYDRDCIAPRLKEELVSSCSVCRSGVVRFVRGNTHPLDLTLSEIIPVNAVLTCEPPSYGEVTQSTPTHTTNLFMVQRNVVFPNFHFVCRFVCFWRANMQDYETPQVHIRTRVALK